MQLIDYHQLVMQGMHHINELTRLDVVWYGIGWEKVHAFMSAPPPALLDFNVGHSYPAIDGLCREKRPYRYCLAGTSSFLEFVFIPLEYEGESQGLVRVGPFLTGPLPEKQLSAFLMSLALPVSRCQALRAYYDSLPMMQGEAAKSLGHIGLNLFGQTIPRAHSCFFQEDSIDAKELELYEMSLDEDLAIIEARYSQEHKLIQAVAFGTREELEAARSLFLDTELINGLVKRFPDNPLRSVKNLAIVTNTILRHAAETGGLHPAYLHLVSAKYALLIEQAKTRSALEKLQHNMPLDYWQMVRKYAYPEASPFVRLVIDKILLNLNKPLTVTELAEDFGVQPSNLANQFKNETGQTITEFINARRVAEACHYLRNTDMPVGEISRYVGINDANYFSRIFRKQMGMTPLQYRKGQS